MSFGFFLSSPILAIQKCSGRASRKKALFHLLGRRAGCGLLVALGGGVGLLGLSAQAAAMEQIPLNAAYRLALVNEEQIQIASRELAKARLLPWRAIALVTPRGEITGTYTRNKEDIAFSSQRGELGGVLGGALGNFPTTIRPLDTWQGIFSVIQPLFEPSFFPSRQLGKEAVRAIGVAEPIGVREPAPYPEPSGSYADLLEQAYRQRQDLRALEHAAQFQFPRLTPETFAFRDELWTFSLNFQVPLFDGGRRELDLQEANENLAQAKLQVGELRKQIQVEVKQTQVNVETLRRTLETLRQEVSLAQENYNITAKQYGVGLATSLDVNTSLNALNQVRTQLTNQTYAYQLALRAVERAVGVFAQGSLDSVSHK